MYSISSQSQSYAALLELVLEWPQFQFEFQLTAQEGAAGASNRE